jgi:hypothetical protein
MSEQKKIVQIKVLTVDKNVLCQIPYESYIDREKFEKADFLGKLNVDQYNEKCKGSMRVGAYWMLLGCTHEEKTDKCFIIPMGSFFQNHPKTKDLPNLYVT